MIRLQRSFYLEDARLVARRLLGQRLVTEIGGIRTSGLITETEAYLGGDDPASHAYRGPTGRNASMFLEGGHAYVYFIYGMYYCFNVVTGGQGSGEAVLVRGAMPAEGIDTMKRRRNRAVRRDRELADGPGKLAIAFGIGPELNGADLIADPRVWIEQEAAVPEEEILTTPRIGITKGVEHPWRWTVK